MQTPLLVLHDNVTFSAETRGVAVKISITDSSPQHHVNPIIPGSLNLQALMKDQSTGYLRMNRLAEIDPIA